MQWHVVSQPRTVCPHLLTVSNTQATMYGCAHTTVHLWVGCGLNMRTSIPVVVVVVAVVVKIVVAVKVAVVIVCVNLLILCRVLLFINNKYCLILLH